MMTFEECLDCVVVFVKCSCGIMCNGNGLLRIFTGKIFLTSVNLFPFPSLSIIFNFGNVAFSRQAAEVILKISTFLFLFPRMMGHKRNRKYA